MSRSGRASAGAAHGVGEGPGEEEDKQGPPFVGRAGEFLTKMLASVGF